MLAPSSPLRESRRAARSALGRAPFECTVLAIAAVYIALHLSPSSYALALEELGASDGPYIGTPRDIRSDEWRVATPLFQAAVNNDFQETNETSFWGENLRSFIGLPLLNWGVVLKPLVWPFFFVSPALAYSFYWAALAALMLIGWSVLLRTLGLSRRVAALTSLILYFTPFVQAWSGPSPLLAFFPWMVVAFIRIRSPSLMAVVVAGLVAFALTSLLYIPALPPLAFLAIVLCLGLRPDALRPGRALAGLTGVVAGGAIALAYFEPVLEAYANSIYPGRRWFDGGGLSVWRVASQFLPGTTTEGYTHLVAENICEAATVASWLPVLALCFIDVRRVRGERAMPETRRALRSLSVMGVGWLTLTAWQLLPVPPLSYALGLGLSPEARTVFASGTLLLVAAAYGIDKLPLRLGAARIAAFTAVVIAAWLGASFDLHASNRITVRDELLVAFIALGVIPFALVARSVPPRSIATGLLVAALIPTSIGWSLFNPLQSTKVIFEKPDTAVTRRLDALAAERSDGAIATEIVFGAILNGIGYRSVTHVLAVPSPDLFRKYFPDLDDREFDAIFNRYAQISLTRRPRPFVQQPDAIRLPIRTMGRYAAIGASE